MCLGHHPFHSSLSSLVCFRSVYSLLASGSEAWHEMQTRKWPDDNAFFSSPVSSFSLISSYSCLSRGRKQWWCLMWIPNPHDQRSKKRQRQTETEKAWKGWERSSLFLLRHPSSSSLKSPFLLPLVFFTRDSEKRDSLVVSELFSCLRRNHYDTRDSDSSCNLLCYCTGLINGYKLCQSTSPFLFPWISWMHFWRIFHSSGSFLSCIDFMSVPDFRVSLPSLAIYFLNQIPSPFNFSFIPFLDMQ